MRKLKTDNLVINVELVKEEKDQKLYITFIHDSEQAEKKWLINEGRTWKFNGKVYKHVGKDGNE